MLLNTDHLKRCISTLETSLVMYGKATAESIDQEVFRNAIVKGYELAQETSFKLLKWRSRISATAARNWTRLRSRKSCVLRPHTGS